MVFILVPCHPPEEIKYTVVDPHSIELSWETPNCSLTNIRIYFYYTNNHQTVNDNDNNNYEWYITGKNVSLSTAPGETDTMLVTDLIVSLPYRGYIVPCLVDVANGIPSKQIVFQTMPERKYTSVYIVFLNIVYFFTMCISFYNLKFT